MRFSVVGLFYDAVNNEIGAEMAYLEANKLNQAAAVAEAKALRDDDVTKERLARGEHESEDKGIKGTELHCVRSIVFQSICCIRGRGFQVMSFTGRGTEF